MALSSAHSVADLSVDEDNVHVFAFRSQLAYALDARPVSNGNLHMALRFGADAAFADGDTVEAALLGQALNSNVSTDDTVRGFGGVDMSYLSDGGSRFFLGAEAGYDSGDALTLEVAGWVPGTTVGFLRATSCSGAARPKHACFEISLKLR